MLYDVKIQKLAYMEEQLTAWIYKLIEHRRNQLFRLHSSYALKNPLVIYQSKQEVIENLESLCHMFIQSIVKQKDHQYRMAINTLKLVNPLNILEKGYSLVKMDEKVIKNSKDLKSDDIISIKMKEGSVIASVKEVQ